MYSVIKKETRQNLGVICIWGDKLADGSWEVWGSSSLIIAAFPEEHRAKEYADFLNESLKADQELLEEGFRDD